MWLHVAKMDFLRGFCVPHQRRSRSPENGRSYDMATLKRAIKKVWFKKMSMREAARVYQIPPSTLQQKLKALRQKQAERKHRAESSPEHEEAECSRRRSRRRHSSQADEESVRSEEEGEEEEEEEMVEHEDEAAEEEQGEEEDKETVESEAEVNEEEDGLGDAPKEETEEVQVEEVDVMEVEKEEDAYQFGDPESGSLSPKKEEVQMKVQTKAARKAQSQWKPREAKDRTRTRKCATKSSANSKQSPRTPKQSPSRTPKQSPVQTPKQSPQRTSKQSPEVCTVVKGRPRIFSACRAKSRVQESKVKTGCDIVKHTLGKGRLKTKLPDKKSKPKEVAKTEWDSELTQEEEDELIRQGQDFKSQGLHLAMDILLDFAQNILNENPYRMRSFVDNRPTKEWYQNFVRRHPILNAPVLTVRKTARQISQEEERKRKAAEPMKSPTTSKKKTKKKPAKGSRKRKDSQAESSYSEVDDSGNAGTTTEEEIDTNICSMCQDEYNDQPDEWIGCSSCERWFHKFCIHIDVTGYSDKEIEELDFICEFCGCGGVT